MAPMVSSLLKAFFGEFFSELEGHSFDIRTAEKVFNDMVTNEENLQLYLNVEK